MPDNFCLTYFAAPAVNLFSRAHLALPSPPLNSLTSNNEQMSNTAETARAAEDMFSFGNNIWPVLRRRMDLPSLLHSYLCNETKIRQRALTNWRFFFVIDEHF